MAYDSDHANVVMFGGAGSQLYDDTWLWTPSCWQQAEPTTSPSRRSTAAAAYDPTQHVLLAYGGRGTTDNWLDDTWTWNGTNWTLVQETKFPVLRFAMAAFDPALDKVVVYGLAQDFSPQTWTWDGTWQQVSTGTEPPSRAASALAYDPSSHTVILFGGRSPNLAYLADTWSFNGVNWNLLSPSASPTARQNHLIATVSNGVVLFGGDGRGATFADTWIWTDDAWHILPTLHSPSGWGGAGITSRNGQPFLLAYGSLNGPAQTYSFSQGDWSAAS